MARRRRGRGGRSPSPERRGDLKRSEGPSLLVVIAVVVLVLAFLLRRLSA
jgi:hypothetical protein